MAVLTQYTQVLSQPEETFTYQILVLCPDCAEGSRNLSKMGRVHMGKCDRCREPSNPRCTSCGTDEYGASALQPSFCYQCAQAMLRGRVNRFDIEVS